MRRHELLGNVGLGVWHFGLFLDQDLSSVVSLGTACFSHTRGRIAQVAMRHNCRIVQICRGATIAGAPVGAPSHLIAFATREMWIRHGPMLVVAYADPSLGEVGTIYQACNAIYTGLTDPKGQANYVIHGRRMSAWQVRKQHGTRDRTKLVMVDPRFEILPLIPKHRYVIVAAPPLLRRSIRRVLLSLALPYPKRHDVTRRVPKLRERAVVVSSRHVPACHG